MKAMHMFMFLGIIFLVSFTLSLDNDGDDVVRIVLDAGHGGKDQGANVGDIHEANLNLTITLMLKDMLVQSGIEVILTRSGDYDLSTDDQNRKKTDAINRVRLVNESNADLFISIHMNKFSNPKYFGSQTFFSPNIAVNRLFAHSIQSELIASTNTTRSSREIRNIFIIDKIKVPGVLVEAGFMSNPEELALLQTTKHQQIIAQSIFDGIKHHLILM